MLLVSREASLVPALISGCLQQSVSPPPGPSAVLHSFTGTHVAYIHLTFTYRYLCIINLQEEWSKSLLPNSLAKSYKLMWKLTNDVLVEDIHKLYETNWKHPHMITKHSYLLVKCLYHVCLETQRSKDVRMYHSSRAEEYEIRSSKKVTKGNEFFLHLGSIWASVEQCGRGPSSSLQSPIQMKISWPNIQSSPRNFGQY